VDADFGFGVFQVREKKNDVHDVGEFEFVRALRNERFPVGALGMAGVYGDEAAARGVKICLKPEDRAVVVDEIVLSVEIVKQLDYRCVRLREVLVVQAILRLSTLPDGND